jgi:creatinine amidohydrolase
LSFPDLTFKNGGFKPMTGKKIISVAFFLFLMANILLAQEVRNPLYHEGKIKNYLPHMSFEEVEEALRHTDMVIIPLGSIEQHGPQLPLGTDFLIAFYTSLLIAEKSDVIVAPVVFVGFAEHHMGFPGTMTISTETLIQVVVEAAKSLIRHGFRRIMILNRHGGNRMAVNLIVHKINTETDGVAVDISELPYTIPPAKKAPPLKFDSHAGPYETSLMLYLTPPLVDMEKAVKPELTLPSHLLRIAEAMEKDAALSRIFWAQTFLPEETGKKTSTREMTETGVFATGDPKEATAERGKLEVDAFVAAACSFIEKWKRLEPLKNN